MPAPYGLEIIESCIACQAGSQEIFSNLLNVATQAILTEPVAGGLSENHPRLLRTARQSYESTQVVKV